jgi:O-antigen/teichoic acid export membrane protein
MPLLLKYLGQEGLGVWIIGLSLMGLVATFNSGLSLSLVTLIGRANTEASGLTLRRLVTSATLIAGLTACGVFAIFLPVTLIVDWEVLLKLDIGLSGDEVQKMMIVLVTLLSFGMISSVPRQVMMGRMHGYLANLLDFVGVVTGAVGLIFGIILDAPLWMLALFFMGPSTLTAICGGLLYLRRIHVPLFARNNFHRQTLAQLGRDSLRMFGYHSAYSVSSQSDVFLIGIILGAPAAAAYGIAQRVFSLPIMIAFNVNNAQWPAMARADVSGEHAIIGRMIRHTLIIGSGGATVLAIILALGYQSLIVLWLGQHLETDQVILFGMVTWVLVATIVNTLDSLLRARNETLLLMRSMMVMAVLNITVTLLLLPRIGAAGAIWGSVTGYLLALLLPYSLRLWQGPGMPGFRKRNNGKTDAG